MQEIIEEMREERNKVSKEAENLTVYPNNTYNCSVSNVLYPDVSSECFSVRFDSGSNYLAGAYSNGTVHIYNFSAPSNSISIKVGYYPVTCLRWKPNLSNSQEHTLVTVTAEGIIDFFHYSTGKLLYTIEDQDNPLMCLDFSPDGMYFATGGSEKVVRLYDDNTKTLLKVLKPIRSSQPGHSNRILSVHFNQQDSNMLVSGGWDNSIIIYDIREESIVNGFYGPHVSGDAIDILGDYILTGSWDTENQIQLWDSRTFKLVKTVELEEQSYIYTTRFSRNIKANVFAAGGSTNNMFRIFENDTSEKNPQCTSKNMKKSCYSCDFSKDGKYCAFGCGDGLIRILGIEPTA